MSKQTTFKFDSSIENEMENKGFNSYGRREELAELDFMDFLKINKRELDVGDEYTGTPELTFYSNDGKLSRQGKPLNFDSLRLRVWDVENSELLDIYTNIPKVDDHMITNPLRKGSKFFRGGFDLVKSFYKNVNAPIDEKANKLENVDIFQIIDYVNEETDTITIQITEGHSQDHENSAEIISIN